MTRIIIILCLCTAFLQAEEVPSAPKITAEKVVRLLLTGKPLSSQQQCSFAELEYLKPGEVKELISLEKLTATEDEYKQVAAVYDQLYSKKNKQYDVSSMGLTVGWYLIVIEDTVSSLPLITKVEAGSAASAAGLLAGDVIERMGRFELEGNQTRNEFVKFLHNWPDSEPLGLKVRRSDYRDPSSTNTKRVKKELQLYSLAAREKQ